MIGQQNIPNMLSISITTICINLPMRETIQVATIAEILFSGTLFLFRFYPSANTPQVSSNVVSLVFLSFTV